MGNEVEAGVGSWRRRGWAGGESQRRREWRWGSVMAVQPAVGWLGCCQMWRKMQEPAEGRLSALCWTTRPER